MPLSLWVLCGIVMLEMMGFGIVLPLLPFAAQRLGASPLEVTLIIAAFPAMHLLMAPLWGRVSDRWGRRPLLLGGVCASTLSYLAFGLADTLWVVAASRIVAGMAGATYGVAQAAVADVTSETDRTAGLGYLGAAYGVGLMLGPAIGGSGSLWGFSVPGYVAAGLCGVNAVVAWLVLPETTQTLPRRPPDTAVPTWSVWLRAFQRFPLSVLVTIYGLMASTLEGIVAILALYLARALGLGAVEVGLLWTWAGVIQIVVRGLLVGRWVRRVGEPRLIVLGAGVLGGALVLLPVMPSLPWTFVAATLYSAGAGLLFPALLGLTSRTVGQEVQGGMLGGAQAVGGLGRVLGPLWAGWLFQQVSITSPFLLGAGLCGIAAVLARTLPDPARVHGASDAAARPTRPLGEGA